MIQEVQQSLGKADHTTYVWSPMSEFQSRRKRFVRSDTIPCMPC